MSIRQLRKELSEEYVSKKITNGIDVSAKAMEYFLKDDGAKSSIEAKINSLQADIDPIKAERSQGKDPEALKEVSKGNISKLEKEREALKKLEKAQKDEKEFSEKISNTTEASSKEAYQKELVKAREQKADATNELLQMPGSTYVMNFTIKGTTINNESIPGKLESLNKGIAEERNKINAIDKKLELEKNGPQQVENLKLLLDSNPKEYLQRLVSDGIDRGMSKLNENLSKMSEDELRKFISQNQEIFAQAGKVMDQLGEYIAKSIEDDKKAEKLSKKVHHELPETLRDSTAKFFGEAFGVKTSTDISKERQNLAIRSAEKFVTGGYEAWETAGEVLAVVSAIGSIGNATRDMVGKKENEPYSAAVNSYIKNAGKNIENLKIKAGLTEKKGEGKKAETVKDEAKEETIKAAAPQEKEKKSRINYVHDYGWTEREMATWKREYRLYIKVNSFAMDAVKNLGSYAKFEEQMNKHELKIEDARIIYTEVMLAKAEHDLKEDKKEKNHFNVSIKKLYEDFNNGEKNKEEVTQLMYALDLSYEAAKNAAAAKAKISNNKNDMELLEKAIKIDAALNLWIKDESTYEYERLLKELKELNEKERERLYNLLRGISTKVAKAPSSGEDGSSSAGQATTTKVGTSKATAANLLMPGHDIRR